MDLYSFMLSRILLYNIIMHFCTTNVHVFFSDVLQISQLMSSNFMSVAKLESNLTQIISQCQSHYSGKPKLATDADSKVVFLCFLFEQILSHGLRSKVNFSTNSRNIQWVLITAPCTYQFLEWKWGCGFSTMQFKYHSVTDLCTSC